ncbi:MAG: multifunctional oxoglutarate decarboxylase/oxoglutarate dehydrogenase thiamine pyrophosphate-binding subunit/dihydrolipoyllysine-residue succinyltransferase subunit [Actinomycetota bacterium]|nr:MAG: multifunctional oxoglutarate decarboxylase/oxoglutarate dehydrogenase thiamine pyrophosphate-binding subunit/dihydrolipoyllysine-residue succinyltransferase subunit [Actinomycetota bacterium]
MPNNRSLTYGAFGPNAWLVDEMYEQFQNDPSSVSPSWQEFFADYKPISEQVVQGPEEVIDAASQVAPPALNSTYEVESAPVAEVPVTSRENVAADKNGAKETVAATPAAQQVEGARILRGASAKIVSNMEASLEVPTATSVRSVPAKLLEVNRSVINNQLARVRGGKVSFTHLIGFAVVQAMKAVPAMNSVFIPNADGKGNPGVIKSPTINLGIAVDVAKSDGSRSLYVPVIRGAESQNFAQFLNAYEDLIRKVRTNKLSPDDFAGATASLTNPGTIGTEHSIPRLMLGQGVIIGVGSLGYSAELASADPAVLAELGVSKSVTITSTYDHRVIQGAESGLFLARIYELLTGKHNFYEDVFDSIGVIDRPVAWQQDSSSEDSEFSKFAKHVRVQTLINNYRVRGHLMADLDPLGIMKPSFPAELDPHTFGLTVWDLDRIFFTGGFAGKEKMSLSKILSVLRDSYCRTVGYEYMHIQDPEQKKWIQTQVEGVTDELGYDEKRYLLSRLNAAEAFERFLHTRYIGQKRFGLEGAESAVAFVDEVLQNCADANFEEAVIGMAHRGRLNILANIVGKSYGQIFKEFEGNLDPTSVQGSGDVKYHKGAVGRLVARSGKEITVSLASNPSHLEAVDPVVEGMARAKQDIIRDRQHFSVLPLLIHGDAAFAGQGVVAETLNLSQLGGYRTGGTVHLVINNQLGFTTNPDQARSSTYATDVAKMIQAPIFHVNGDDPESVIRVARLAFKFRQQFQKDVVVDLVCYRRFGHNEGDEPSYTQPKMYERIESRRSVRKLYTESLVSSGDLTIEDAEKALDDFLDRLQVALDETRSESAPNPTSLPPAPLNNVPMEKVATGVSREVLEKVSNQLYSWPDGFTVHPKLLRQLDSRKALFDSGQVDWSLGEAFAFGSLLLEGVDVRFAGQDSRRGTFSHRHAALIDHKTGADYVPLEQLSAGGALTDSGMPIGRFMIYDSLLSEYAALGFEYGYSVVRKDALVCWEAQFGDFFNGAQIIVDQFLVAAEDKWDQRSGLVLLLPHGYEGQGPEHSSARIERFLQLCAGSNIAVVNPTTSAQFFHLLRAQVARSHQRPLVVFTPKSLLRARQSRSAVDELVSESFKEVIDDSLITSGGVAIDPKDVRRLILCSGKVAYDAIARRDAIVDGKEAGEISAVVRVEQLYPWPIEELNSIFAQYANVTEVVWLQEEPENMGAWNFCHSQLHALLREDFVLRHVSRVPSGSPATGSAAMHALELQDLLYRALTLKCDEVQSSQDH